MLNPWNSNTIRAGKWLAVTIAVAAFSYVSSMLGLFEYVLSAGLAFVTTYYGVSAIRCKHAGRKDVWAGIGITLIAGVIGIGSIVALANL